MDVAVRIVVPAVVVFIMTVVGLGLRPDDFRPVARAPRIIVLATLAQIALIPAAAVGIAVALDPPSHLVTGMIIVAACPPAAIANLFVELGGWNTPLSVTLTAVGNLLAPFLIPPVLLGISTLGIGMDDWVRLPVLVMMGQITGTLILPLALGMGLRHVRPAATEAALPLLRRLSVGGILLVAGLVAAAGGGVLVTDGLWIGALAAVFTLVTMALGLLTGLALRRDRRDVATLAVDFAIRNGGIAIFIATTVLLSVEAAVFVVGVVVAQVPIGLGLLAAARARRLQSD
jgi:BASS family bile acid:Na+ symporter